MQVDFYMHIKKQKTSVLFIVFYVVIRDKIIKYLMFPFSFSYKQDLFKILRYNR